MHDEMIHESEGKIFGDVEDGKEESKSKQQDKKKVQHDSDLVSSLQSDQNE